MSNCPADQHSAREKHDRDEKRQQDPGTTFETPYKGYDLIHAEQVTEPGL